MVTIRQKIVKTRKAHICHGCQKKFPSGTEMEYWVCKDGGAFMYGYMCVDCLEYIADNDLYDEDGLPEGIVADLRRQDDIINKD